MSLFSDCRPMTFTKRIHKRNYQSETPLISSCLCTTFLCFLPTCSECTQQLKKQVSVFSSSAKLEQLISLFHLLFNFLLLPFKLSLRLWIREEKEINWCLATTAKSQADKQQGGGVGGMSVTNKHTSEMVGWASVTSTWGHTSAWGHIWRWLWPLLGSCLEESSGIKGGESHKHSFCSQFICRAVGLGCKGWATPSAARQRDACFAILQTGSKNASGVVTF